MSLEIKDFEELVKSFLKPGQKYVSHTSESLLSPGENYGSIMLKVDIKILNDKDEEDVIHCVAKTCPPRGFLWDALNIKVTFKKELAVYTTIVPALNDFGKEKGIDCLLDFFPKLLASRISIDPNSDEVDEHALLLMENLKEQGYDIGDRYNGFDEDTARYVLKDLAVLHAATIAYKAAKPDEFEAKFSQYLKTDYNLQITDAMMSGYIKNLVDAASRNPECIPHLHKIEEILPTMADSIANPAKGKDMFATIAHQDYWINNTMLKYENGRVVSNKMVDFQLLGFNSLAHDIVFFMYGNLSLSVMESKIDELIKFYYDELIKSLVRLEHDVSEYSFESMMEEFALVAKDYQFTRTLLMLNPMMLLKGKIDEIPDMKDFIKEDSILAMKLDVVHPNYYPRVQFVLLDFVRRGWV